MAKNISLPRIQYTMLVDGIGAHEISSYGDVSLFKARERRPVEEPQDKGPV